MIRFRAPHHSPRMVTVTARATSPATKRFAVIPAGATRKISPQLVVQQQSIENLDEELVSVGVRSIAETVSRCRSPVIIIEAMRNFGDILHSTSAVRHYRKTFDGSVVWAIEEKYASEFCHFTADELGPHAIAKLPSTPSYPADGPYRLRWLAEARKLPGVVQVVSTSPHPTGWNGNSASLLSDTAIAKAKITHLSVPLKPWLPISDAERSWADGFIENHSLRNGFIALEYFSYSLAPRPSAWYEKLIQLLPLPVVAIAGKSDPAVAGAIDARGCSYRQAKALIAKSNLFIGRGSGLSMVAASGGCQQKVVELIPPFLSMIDLGYRYDRRNHRSMPEAQQGEVARAIIEMLKPRTRSRVRALVPMPIHSGFFSQLFWLFPDVDWVLEGTEFNFEHKPIEKFFPIDLSRLSLSGRRLEDSKMQDFDFVIASVEQHGLRQRLSQPDCPTVWRSYFTEIHKRKNGPIVYAAEHVRRRSRVYGETVLEVRDPNFWSGWRGSGTNAVFVAAHLNMHKGRYEACGGPFLEKLRKSVPTKEFTAGLCPLENLREAYRNCGVYVEAPPPIEKCPHARVFSGSFIEAMLVGVPIVARDCNEFGLLIEHGVDGLKAKTDEELVQLCRLVLRDKILAAELGKNSRQKALKIFNPVSARRKWVAALQQAGVELPETIDAHPYLSS